MTTIPKQSYLPDVMAGIDAEIAALRAKKVSEPRSSTSAPSVPAATPAQAAQAWRDEPLSAAHSGLRHKIEEAARAAKDQETKDALERRLTFLTNLRRELDSDPQLVSFIDSMVGNQVKAAERRQRMYSALIAVVSLLVGWLLSGISPATTLAHMLPH